MKSEFKNLINSIHEAEMDLKDLNVANEKSLKDMRIIKNEWAESSYYQSEQAAKKLHEAKVLLQNVVDSLPKPSKVK